MSETGVVRNAAGKSAAEVMDDLTALRARMVATKRSISRSPDTTRRDAARHYLSAVTGAITVEQAQNAAREGLGVFAVGGELSIEEVTYRGVMRRIVAREARCYTLLQMRREASLTLRMHGPRRRAAECLNGDADAVAAWRRNALASPRADSHTL